MGSRRIADLGGLFALAIVFGLLMGSLAMAPAWLTAPAEPVPTAGQCGAGRAP